MCTGPTRTGRRVDRRIPRTADGRLSWAAPTHIGTYRVASIRLHLIIAVVASWLILNRSAGWTRPAPRSITTKLPHGDQALVEHAKVRDHLLSSDHPIGRFKARAFAVAGYRREHWQQLREDLRALGTDMEVVSGPADCFGQSFVGRGWLTGPSGILLPVVSVWLIPSKSETPRLVTAYPGRAP